MKSLAIILLLFLPCLSQSAGVGTGFGENLWVLTSARQAGTGGVALEDPWREGMLLDASTVVMAMGPYWAGVGGQGGLGRKLRLGFQTYLFRVTTPRINEFSDGSFGGETGTVGAEEWGGSLIGQYGLWSSGPWRLAGLARVSGVMVKLPDVRHAGAAGEVGLQGQRLVGSGRMLTGWALVGPIGSGGGRMFSSQVLAGIGWLARIASGITGRPEGYGIGGELQMLSEGLAHGGLGALYWIGDPRDTGETYYLRAGIRMMEGAVQTWQPRGGLGVLLRNEGGMGLQLDYAVVPQGELGLYHYATISLRSSR